MPLRIYIRQHSPKCLNRLQDRVTKGELKEMPSNEALMDYRFCKCGWWMYGTSDVGVNYKPHALKVYSYAAADAKRKEANKNPGEESRSNIPLDDLKAAFLSNRRTVGITAETEAIYSRIATRLSEFCKQLKPPVTLANRVTRENIFALRQSWVADGLGKTTVNYHVAILRMLFGYGMETGVNGRKLKDNPTDGVDPIVKERLRGADADDEEGDENGRTLPLDEEGDENYRRVLAGVESFLMGKLVVPGRKFARAKLVSYSNDAARFGFLLELMYETGLRVSDAIHFRPEKIEMDDEVASYTTKQIKTGDDVTVFFPLELAARIKALKPLYKHYVFYDNSLPWRKFISDWVWRMLHDLGEAIGVPNLRPHRFRDSYAVNRLNENMSIEQLSLLLGHRRPETTRKYYNPWVKSRHDNLRANYLAARRTGEFAKQGVVVEITTARKQA